MVIRAEKVLARARELRQERMKDGVTILVDRDVELLQQRRAAAWARWRRRLLQVAGVTGALALALVVALQAYALVSGPMVEAEPLSEAADTPPTGGAEVAGVAIASAEVAPAGPAGERLARPAAAPMNGADAARAAAPAGPPGRLEVRVNVSGATVEIDHLSYGHTPLRRPMSLDPGHYTVWVSRKGYRLETREVDVRSGELARVAVKLARSAPGSAAPVDDASRPR